MANLVITSVGTNSVSARVDNLQFTWGTNNNYSQFYITVSGVGSSSPSFPPTSSSSFSTGTVTKSGLSPNTTYTVTGIVTHSGTNTTVGSTSITTSGPPNDMGTISVSQSSPNAPTDITWSWSNPGGASSYLLTGAFFNSSWPSTGYTMVGAAAGTYSLTVTPKNAFGNGGASTRSITIFDAPPTAAPVGAPTVSATRATLSTSLTWSSVAGAAYYFVWKNDGAGSGDVLLGGGPTYGNSLSVTVDREYWLYTYKVLPANDYGSGSIGSTTARTLDTSAPSIVIDSAHTSTTQTTITIPTFPADYGPYGASGINQFFWKKNGTVVATTTSSTHTYTGLVASTNYFLSVYVTDHDGNASVDAGISITTSGTRPSNWAWFNPKIAGDDFNITSGEWAALQNKVNEFREYGGLADYTFTVNCSTGQPFTAAAYNQVIAALAPMVVVATVAPGDDVTAAILNGLRDSINSIP